MPGFAPNFPHEMDWSKVIEELDRQCLELKQDNMRDYVAERVKLVLFSGLSVALRAGMK